jgi:hypothetical protein
MRYGNSSDQTIIPAKATWDVVVSAGDHVIVEQHRLGGHESAMVISPVKLHHYASDRGDQLAPVRILWGPTLGPALSSSGSAGVYADNQTS